MDRLTALYSLPPAGLRRQVGGRENGIEKEV